MSCTGAVTSVSDFAGAWLRTQLFEPKGHLTHHEDPSVRLVLWLQTSCGIFVDIRVDLPKVSISTSKSFAGHITYQDDLSYLTWTRVIDYRPLSPPDIGKVQFTAENVLQEDGVLEGDDFSETWVRESAVTSCVAVELTELGSAVSRRKGYFIIVGDWFALSVCRHSNPPLGITEQQIADTFDTVLVPDSILYYMLQHVTVAGKCDDNWTVVHSLDPDMVGISLLDSLANATLSNIFTEFKWKVIEGSVPDVVGKLISHQCQE